LLSAVQLDGSTAGIPASAASLATIAKASALPEINREEIIVAPRREAECPSALA